LPSRPAVHRSPGSLSPEERRAQYNRDRGTFRQRGYTAEWDKASREYRDENPFCVMCKAQGLLVLAKATDHIIAHRGNPILFWDRSNWQGLCDNHHSQHKQRLECQEIET
jgi:5-methylcytosine-specific restriction protein A